jgi:hypothetical protein
VSQSPHPGQPAAPSSSDTPSGELLDRALELIAAARDGMRANIATLEDLARFRQRWCIGRGIRAVGDPVWEAVTAGAIALQLRLEALDADGAAEQEPR